MQEATPVNVIFLSPHFPANNYLYCTALRAAGANVLGVGDGPYDALRPELKVALAEYYFLPRMESYDDLARAVGELVRKHGAADRIESLNEYWLGHEARLRQDFNVWGPRPADLERTRRKTGMRNVFRQAGIPIAEGEAVTGAEQLERFARRHGFPLIFKPDVGVGAAHVFPVRDYAELKPHLLDPPQGYVVEKFVRGELVTFDGLTDRDGRIVFWTSMTVCAGIMEIVTELRQMSYIFQRRIPAALEALGRKAVRGFGLKERFFHTEFIREGGERYTALEINVRPPGGFSVDMMNYQCDFDLFRVWAELLTKGQVETAYERKYYVAHAARRDGCRYRHSHEEVLRRLMPLVAAHMAMPQIFSPAMGNYTYLIRHAELGPLKEAIAFVQELAE